MIKDINNSLFSILVDESRDISIKERMAVVLRCVNKKGLVIERFVGIEHVANTTSSSLKEAIDKLFSRYGLSMTRLRGQGYDGASNMQGEFNGLKTLILKENPCAFYVHYFAHQLQLCLVYVVKKHTEVASLFSVVSSVANVVGASSKQCDILREKQGVRIAEALDNGEILSGRGLNQETSIKRSGDTRWGSHYGTLLNLVTLFSSMIDVLGIVAYDGANSEQRSEANNLLCLMLSFDFVFSLHFMRTLLGIINELSIALQRKDQDIVNAMNLVKLCKQRLQIMRDDGWDSTFNQVSTFCTKYNIMIPNMDDRFVALGRPRFDSFSAFDKRKLIHFAEYYPKDFSTIELLALDDQLETYIIDMRSSDEFMGLKGIGDLAQMMVHTRRNGVHTLVYRLLTLSLLLPVVTTTVERVFSAMNIVKNRLWNRMGDQLMNDILLVYIEKDVFSMVDKEPIMKRFQAMKKRRGRLKGLSVGDCSLSGHKDGLKVLRQKGEVGILFHLVLLCHGGSVKLHFFATVPPRDVGVVLISSVFAIGGLGRVGCVYLGI
ncbi:uncharacterized protein LOC115695026 [Cannabis sativa]|uniref:uncharacterized protein LOC115695026 n=1 Tax=Cannabis sativa TaxID=3483 RepID=UPI0029CA0A8F|nr:uncharacterized protein LOC115695026 [Cannabis sativa]